MRQFSKGRLISFVVLLGLILAIQAQKTQRKQNADTLPFTSLFEDVVDSFTQQMRKIDLTITKLFKTFIISDQISFENVEDLLKFATSDLDYDITSQHHLDEMLIDIRKSNSKDINSSNNFCRGASCGTNMNHGLYTEEKPLNEENTSKRMLQSQDACNGGKLQLVTVDDYKCGKNIVSKETYEGKSWLICKS